jgi:hypothetical protein
MLRTFAVVFFISLPSYSNVDFPPVEVTASMLRVRDTSGTHLCSVPRGTKLKPIGRDANSEKIQVQLDAPNCPRTGVVDADWIEVPGDEGGGDESEAKVSRQATNFRASPSLGSTVHCQLRIGTGVRLLSETPSRGRIPFYKVRLKEQIPGCPSEGYVAAGLLEPGDIFESLPVYNPRDHRRQTEAQGACPQCDEEKRRGTDLAAQGRQITTAIRRGSEQTQIARALTDAAKKGYGHVGKGLCYRAVKQIIANTKVNGQKIADVSKLQGGSAIDAMEELPKAGFTNTYPDGCKEPGAILVYKGAAHQFLGDYKKGRRDQAYSKARKYMLEKYGVRFSLGDIHGHIEILGTDGKYHHFVDSSRPINQVFGGGDRRKLVGCFLKQ